MIIALDAGHYNDTPGKRCLKSIDPNETRERFLNARMTEHVEELLKAYDCEVMRCDDRTGKGDTDLTTAVQSLISKSSAAATLRRKEYTGEIVSTVIGTDAYAVLAQDALLAEHRNTESLFVRVEFDIGPTPYTVVKSWAANAVDTIVRDSTQNLQLVHRWDGSGKKSIGYPTTLITDNTPAGVGSIIITAAGELRCYSRSNNYAIRPSKYKVIIEW